MLRPALLALLCAFATSSCSGSDFASGAARTQKADPKKATDGKDGKDDGTDDSSDEPQSTAKDGKDDDGTKDAGQADASEDQSNGSLSEDEQVVNATKGKAVAKVGVNFEDIRGGGDHDYNDAVLCFEGKFKVDGSNVVSIAKQAIVGTTFSSSGCNHNVRVDIIGKDGTKESTITFDSSAAQPVPLNFKVGSRLEVYMTPYDGCQPGVERNMHAAEDAVVAMDQCNSH